MIMADASREGPIANGYEVGAVVPPLSAQSVHHRQAGDEGR